MAIYLYCLLSGTHDPPAHLRGIDDSPVRAVDVGGLRAWVSDTGGSAVAPSPERARSHDRVVRAALELATPLPARFGQVVPDEAALESLVEPRRAAFAATLERLAGMVEMTVRAILPVPPREGPVPTRGEGRAVSGREYLERVAATHREERNLLAEEGIVREHISSAVRELVRAESFAGAAAGSSLMTVSHLIPRGHIENYRRAIGALRADQPSLAIMVSGPWAPYSFAEAIG
ncbi:MAG TPA: GvpL/GvpF family gas vesicle protein [Gemmatimonadaceae bacterium]|nr:GvpL/GvpF family gas vesicle protein [Gemmatimonadaceae bacterium]